MRKLKSEDMGIIFITHFLDQVYEISDRITVLRNGNLVGTYITSALPRLELIKKMIGRSLTEYEDMTKVKIRDLENISEVNVAPRRRRWAASDAIEPFDLELHAGEVVGLAGLLGSGRTEMAQLIIWTRKT